MVLDFAGHILLTPECHVTRPHLSKSIDIYRHFYRWTDGHNA